jgi:hypothetical protein
MKQKIKNKENGIITISIPLLKQMATTKKLKDILQNHIDKETIPTVRNAWIEYFLEIKNKKILLNKR